MYLVSLCREHLVAWPAVALFRQVAQDKELLPRKQGLLFAAKTRKGEKRHRLVWNCAKFPLLFCPEPVLANVRVHSQEFKSRECGVFVYMKRHAVVSISALPLIADLYIYIDLIILQLCSPPRSSPAAWAAAAAHPVL